MKTYKYQPLYLHQTYGVFTKKVPNFDYKGTKRWYNDKQQLHRLDGPAEEYVDGRKYYYIEGIEYTHERLLEYLLT